MAQARMLAPAYRELLRFSFGLPKFPLQTQTMSSTDYLQLAAQFVSNTTGHVFLTGKAGTGKTTFLRKLAQSTYKRFVIVAPTGVAALNAQGTTIHSQFLLPLASFIPERKMEGIGPESNFIAQDSLARFHPLNDVRRRVLRQIDLLIIDEVSMLRPDVLDAIDYRLKSARRNFREPFGGVQLLLIGDLFQLSPIVKDHEWQVLKRYYNTPFFYSARAFTEQDFVHIELDKIFRQSDNTFVELLNRIRNNESTQADFDLLNAHYKSESEIQRLKGYITLTTHVRQSDEINRRMLSELSGRTMQLEAEVSGQFPEHMYPVDKTIELKVGTQVMFVKNDSSGKGLYYNGKLAEVVRLEAPDVVEVRMLSDNSLYVLKKEEWSNKRYVLNEATKELDEEQLGSFTQFPLRLAWAVTIHKSQGLTFDKAIIDAGSAFSPGQVYVALSRLTCLEGLVLRTKLHAGAISTHRDVVEFSAAKPDHETLQNKLQEQQRRYVLQTMEECFHFGDLLGELNQFQSSDAGQMEFEDDEMRNAMKDLREAFAGEQENLEKFRSQLKLLLVNGDFTKLKERLEKGSNYYLDLLWKMLYKLLLHREHVSGFSKTKAYLSSLDDIDQLLMNKITRMDTVAHLVQSIHENRPIEKMPEQERQRLEKRKDMQLKAEEHTRANPKASLSKSGRRKKGAKPKVLKGDTYRITYAMFLDGMSIERIAEDRGLVRSTIEGHLRKGVAEDEIPIERIFTAAELAELKSAFRRHKGSLNKMHEEYGRRFSYSLLRIIQDVSKNP